MMYAAFTEQRGVDPREFYAYLKGTYPDPDQDLREAAEKEREADAEVKEILLPFYEYYNPIPPRRKRLTRSSTHTKRKRWERA